VRLNLRFLEWNL